MYKFPHKLVLHFLLQNQTIHYTPYVQIFIENLDSKSSLDVIHPSSVLECLGYGPSLGNTHGDSSKQVGCHFGQGMLSTLLDPSYFGMILFLCIAKLVSCDFHNLLKCSKYAWHISTKFKHRNKLDALGHLCPFRRHNFSTLKGSLLA